MGKSKSSNPNPSSNVTSDPAISAGGVCKFGDTLLLLDVRKPKAREASGNSIPRSRYCHPFDALNWAGEYAGKRIVVFCVHGHEVSQGVCGFLRDEGIEAYYLEGGFEAWLVAGYPVNKIGEAGNDE